MEKEGEEKESMDGISFLAEYPRDFHSSVLHNVVPL
jgi:hypothetical protein